MAEIVGMFVGSVVGLAALWMIMWGLVQLVVGDVDEPYTPPQLDND